MVLLVLQTSLLQSACQKKIGCTIEGKRLRGQWFMSDYKIGQKPAYVKPPSHSMDFKVLNEPIQGIYRTIRDCLQKEEPDPQGFHYLLGTLLTTGLETHRAVVRLIDQSESKQFSFQAMVLIRTMVDSLFTVLALKTDPSKYSRTLDLAGYRATLERHQREKARYGNNPEWKDHLEEQQKFLDFRASRLQLSDEERNNPQRLSYWPTPGRMLNPRGGVQFPFSGDERTFLAHVDTWHYGDLSSYGHLQWGGVALSVYAADREEQWVPHMLESRIAMESLLFLLMLLSEVEAVKKYGTNEDLKYLWVVLGDVFGNAKDYYAMRYQELLA
jgi:hypothetical protein